MTLSTVWDLPPEFESHALSIAAYRGTAAACAAKYQLQVGVFHKHLRGYALLGLRSNPDDPELLQIAKQMCEDLTQRCCMFTPWWFRHVSQFSTPEQLCSAPSLDKIEAAAELAEIDNITVETNNATIRRFVARLFQGKRPDLQDVSSSWVLSQEKREQESPFGATFQAAEVEPPKFHSGGGGRQRAFVSKFARVCACVR